MTPERLLRPLEWLTWTLVGLWALSSLWYPFGWDQGIMAWVGSTILDGGMPYRDAFDIKGPVAHYVFALAQALFGHNLWGIRVLDLLGLASSGWLISRVVGRYADARTGTWSAVLFVLWFAGLTFWHTAQPDGFAAMFLALGFLPLLRHDSPSLRRTLWAGVMVGLTIAIKPHYAVFLAVPGVHFAATVWRQPRVVAVHLAVLTLGTAATVGSVVAWFAYRSALDALVEVHILYNAQAYTSGASLAIGQRLRGIVEYVRSGELFVVLLPATLIGAARLYRTERAAMWTLTSWAALAFAGVVLQNKFFDYQWIPMFPPVAILSAVGMHSALTHGAAARARRREGDERTPTLGHALFVVILLHAVVQPAFEVANWASYVLGIRDEAAYYDTFGVPGPDHRMARYIEENSEPDDLLIIMGWNIEILYMTRRPTISRLAYSLPVWMGEGTPLRERYRDELMNDLRTTPPELIVVAPQAEPLLGREVSIDEFPEFRRYLDERYRTEVEFGPLILYRLTR